VSAHSVTLDDKYLLERGRVYLTGTQALVRLPLMQKARDQRAGYRTAGFISGYRGSPLGGYDTALHDAKALLQANDIVFQPGLNEDLAATSLWGSQQLNMFEGAKMEGVFGIWYGKGPGVDRCGDVFKHANAAGSSRLGGVLALMGDDHGCHSSTLPHQSEQIVAAAMMPILSPASLQDYLDLGLMGFALSRYAGCWVAIKAVGQTIETSASVDVDPDRVSIVMPEDFAMPEGGLNIRRPDPPLVQEQRLHGPKMAAVAAFARANKLDRIVLSGQTTRLGIVASGKAYLDVMEALKEVGLDDETAGSLGLRVYKLGLVWPVEPVGIREFAQGLDEILVVEEKRGFIEDQITKILYNTPGVRPRVVGKQDLDGLVLLPSEGEINPVLVGQVIAARLLAIIGGNAQLEQRLQRLNTLATRSSNIVPLVTRPPFFCSGCPHNTSTRVPEGSRALAGIGCHGMTVFMPERNTHVWSHMGGEGAGWIGQAPFTKQKHIFQNLGDGTYSHSGLLAIRAASAAGVNITYKILYNDAVAMTGGQAVEGSLSVSQITRQVAAEGAKVIEIVTDHPENYNGVTDLAAGVTVHHRDQLDAVQRRLRELPGLTVLIYDQTCAAEKRRRRKRKTFPDPPMRVFINEAVCEGCGDCSTQSNCVSVQPVETELGRKRRIDQSACNKDFSCLKGFCPSFVTVLDGSLRKAKPAADGAPLSVDDLPLPARPVIDGSYDILITGIGGTGVITIGALLGMAAHLEGMGCTVLDSAGMAQKNGAVMSHVRIANNPEDIRVSRIVAGAARLIIGCDMVVASGPDAIGTAESGTTRAVINGTVTPTAEFVTNNEVDFREAAMRKRISDATGASNADFIDASGIATALVGDAIAVNLFMLGYCFQKGLIPLGRDALRGAIELNGVAVKQSLATFDWGRRAVADWASVAKVARPALREVKTPPDDLASLVARRADDLVGYQNKAYAQRYRSLVDDVIRAAPSGSDRLGRAVAQNFYKLMAYKDEYEVARLYTDGRFLKQLSSQFEGDFRLRFNLAPPIFASRDRTTGHLKKQSYGAWMLTAFRGLARLKFLRGSPLDIFGYTAERRTERNLIGEYETTIRSLLSNLRPANEAVAVEIATLPDRIRGYGHIKEASVARVKAEQADLLARYRNPVVALDAAE
jgi:indolepyruvate ferredoxin oxidoreductase